MDAIFRQCFIPAECLLKLLCSFLHRYLLGNHSADFRGICVSVCETVTSFQFNLGGQDVRDFFPPPSMVTKK